MYKIFMFLSLTCYSQDLKIKYDNLIPNEYEVLFIKELNHVRDSLGLPMLKYNKELTLACYLQHDFIVKKNNNKITDYNTYDKSLYDINMRFNFVYKKVHSWHGLILGKSFIESDTVEYVLGKAEMISTTCIYNNKSYFNSFWNANYSMANLLCNEINRIGLYIENGICVVVTGKTSDFKSENQTIYTENSTVVKKYKELSVSNTNKYILKFNNDNLFKK